MFVTKFMEQNLSGEANSHSTSQEMCQCLWNSQVQESATESSPVIHPLKCSIKAGNSFEQSEIVSSSGKTVKIMLVDRFSV